MTAGRIEHLQKVIIDTTPSEKAAAQPAEADYLAPARGILLGAIAGLVMWILIAAVILMAR